MFKLTELIMTIKYDNRNGMEFTVNVKLTNDTSIMVHVDLTSTRSPALAKAKFRIPYGHHGFIGPFDFNSIEEGICHLLKLIYKDSTIREFRREDMVESIDMLMMTEAPVVNIDVIGEYDMDINAHV
ncbi:C1 protein [Tomato leaf curl Joydebpur betasatellite 2]|uniref:C1 protein n=1 Tax=Tomato leaf curl Joydebpur betasatellite TaxID=436243 RepID=A0A060A070_9VIRU|nr:C1 protein [Tomato leaf curl Joydebpur betasatellite]AIA58516.1 C1 protein [Tomato leaf curl Joydebpur betasatellite]ART89320.1 C1 protein [Tomato leaf curl Joydebpur betasatellite]AYF57946.1 C1 protein [Tomato leaf curl Joydebpur betasatellite]